MFVYVFPGAATLNTPFEAVILVPAIAVTKSAIVSFFEALESLASINPILSAATSSVPPVKLLRSVPPPPPPPEALIVILSALASVVIVTLEPATRVSVSVAVSATTLV